MAAATTTSSHANWCLMTTHMNTLGSREIRAKVKPKAVPNNTIPLMLFSVMMVEEVTALEAGALCLKT